MGAYSIVRGRTNKEEAVGDLKNIKLGKECAMWRSVMIFYVERSWIWLPPKCKLRDLGEENCILAGDRGSTLDCLSIKNKNDEEEKLILIAMTN